MYHDFHQSRLFLSILLILEIVEKIKMLEDEIAESESSDTIRLFVGSGRDLEF